MGRPYPAGTFTGHQAYPHPILREKPLNAGEPLAEKRLICWRNDAAGNRTNTRWLIGMFAAKGIAPVPTG